MSAATQYDPSHAPTVGHTTLGHVVPLPLLIAVGLSLILLTWVTVAATHVDLGRWNLVIALAIAVIKGALVALFFMHLRWDRPFNGVVLIASLMFFAIFIGLALLDTIHYQPDIAAATGTVLPS